jgi:hypothetical protein
VISERTGALDWASRATLSGVCCSLPVDRALLAGQLARCGPLHLDGPATREHVLVCELWTVREGRATPAGVDLGKAAAGWANTAAGLSAMVWGAGLGWLTAMASGRTSELAGTARVGARTGFEGMAALLAQPSGDATRAVSLGPYRELLLAVPDVRIADNPIRYMAVLAMLTDSRIALAIDSGFGYGYAKQVGIFEVAEPQRWTVSFGGSARVRARFSPAPRRMLDVDRVNHWWSQPLLAGLHAGRYTSSWLERRIDANGARWSSLTGSLMGLEDLVPQFPGADSQTALAFEGIDSRISYPRRAG